MATERLLLPRVVSEYTGLSRVTIHRLVRQQKFPAPVKITETRNAWTESSIQAWIADVVGRAA